MKEYIEEKSLVHGDVVKHIVAFHNTLENSNIKWHWHKFYEIVYLKSGSCDLIVDEKSYRMKNGDAILINAYEAHCFEPLTKSVFLVFQFDASVMEEYSRIFSLKYLIKMTSVSALEERIFDGYSNFGDLFDNVSKAIDNLDRASNLLFKSVILYIIHYLIEKNIVILPKQNAEYNEFIYKILEILDYVDDKICERLTTRDVAKSFGYSDSYFCRMFKKIVGRSFMEYILYSKIQYADKLLIDTNKSVTEIASQLNFSSLSYFNRIFKCYKNICPTEYRNRIKQSEKIPIEKISQNSASSK